MATFPITRLRRTRKTQTLRNLIRETHLAGDQLIYPLFISEEVKEPKEISAMPGIYQWPLKSLDAEVERLAKIGIKSVLLFGIPTKKDSLGLEAYNDKGIIQKAIKRIKKVTPDMLVITDVCLCEYTDHGHCGPVIDGYVENDPTVELLSRMALSHIEAGADMVAPSDMMDGRVGAIRTILDKNKHANVPIMAYSAKYASGFYGPFREAAQSAPKSGDRKSYQMDPANVREALREIDLDISEGADIIMVKPALAYLDVIRQTKEKFDHPLAAYNVSGEYSMVKAAAQKGWIDEKRIAMEILNSIRRAGSDIIITYWAPQAVQWIKEE
jgi:porphobilinogen synthase